MVFSGVDVNDEGSLQHIKSALEGRKIAVLVIAAGSQEMDKLENVTKDVIRCSRVSLQIATSIVMQVLAFK